MTYQEIENALPKWLCNSDKFLVCVIDMQGRYAYANCCFIERFPWRAEDLIGSSFEFTVHPEDLILCEIASQECLEKPDKPAPAQIRKPIDEEGTYITTDWDFSAFLDEQGALKGILCVGYDVTTLKRLSQELEIKNRQLERIARHQSHQIRGPVASILGLLEVWEQEEARGQPACYRPELRKAAQKLDRIVHRIVKQAFKP